MRRLSNGTTRNSRAVRIGAAAAVVLCLAFVIGDGRAATSPLVWLGGVDPIVRASMEPSGTSDFMDLFEPGAQWSRAASQLKVFQASTQFFSKAPDEMLTRMFADLKRRDIALSLSALMLSGDGKCGVGIEGYSAPGQMLAIAKRINALGGTLSYVAMDGPFIAAIFTPDRRPATRRGKRSRRKSPRRLNRCEPSSRAFKWATSSRWA